jgi:hypothetical protein
MKYRQRPRTQAEREAALKVGGEVAETMLGGCRSREENLSDDLLWGAQAIADFLGIKVDSIYYLVRMKRLPIGKLGSKTIIASKKRLRRAFANLLDDEARRR